MVESVHLFTLHQWQNGCTEQHVIAAVPDDKLPDLMKDDDGDINGQRLRTLADRLGIHDKQLPAIGQALAEKGGTLRQIIIEAATGSKAGAPAGREKEWKSHSRCWFKSESGGRELAKKVAALGAWGAIGPVMLPLINAILNAAGRPALKQLDL
jgi:putative ATP-dependent endonuclease of the OLD family